MHFVQPLKRAAQVAGSNHSTIYADRKRTWGETLSRVRRLAASLVRLGVADGAPVAILSLNSDRYLEMIYAIAWAGGVFVPMNTRWALPETTYALRDCGARILCVDDSFTAVAASLKADGALLDHVVYLGDGAVPEGMSDMESLVGAASMDVERCGGGDDRCAIFYTGGTTGEPRGVELSHRNLIFSALNWIGAFHVSRSTVYMHVAGLFHMGGAGPAFAVTIAGGTNVIQPKFDAVEAMEAIQKHRVNYTLLIPVMVNSLINEPKLSRYDLSSVTRCHYGGAPMPDAILTAAQEKLPTWRFIQGYGQTEACAVISVLDWEDHLGTGEAANRRKSAGLAMYGWDVRIVGPDRVEVPRREVGEIAARGGGVMLGYCGKPEQTAAVIEDGWLYTGDAAWMDEDGFIYIVDRVKDMIVSGGENVYSTEVENAIYRHPHVLECAVVGIPHPHWGEAVHAVVVAKPGVCLTAGEIIEHCRSLIANYKCPKTVEISAERLPVSPAGKITKNILRERYWQGMTRNVN